MANKIVRLMDMDPPLPIRAIDNGDGTYSLATVVATGDLELGAVELKDGTTDTRAVIDANGLDVDVTRLPALVAGSAVVGKVGIDQTTPGTTNLVATAPVASGAITNRSGTIATGGAAQVLAAANATRRYLLIQNASVGVLWVSPDTTAVAGSPSIALKACTVANDGTGGAVEFSGAYVPPGAISIIGATTGQAFTAKEAG